MRDPDPALRTGPAVCAHECARAFRRGLVFAAIDPARPLAGQPGDAVAEVGVAWFQNRVREALGVV